MQTGVFFFNRELFELIISWQNLKSIFFSKSYSVLPTVHIPLRMLSSGPFPIDLFIFFFYCSTGQRFLFPIVPRVNAPMGFNDPNIIFNVPLCRRSSA